ncbi:MAG TPA: 30S ribosomal protein S16 [Candidatus Woesebacteria bacterium]|nr:30S ribosomal protein S16 [Candidatus Woesebacteria bacterium]
MLKIKLVRFGKRNQPYFRIVVNEARDKRDGSYVEMIGYYIPSRTPKVLELDVKKYQAWLTKGAQPTETVAYLAKLAESGKGFPVKKAKPSRKKLAKDAAAKEAEANPKAEPKTKDEAEPTADSKSELAEEPATETSAEADAETKTEAKTQEPAPSAATTES